MSAITSTTPSTLVTVMTSAEDSKTMSLPSPTSHDDDSQLIYISSNYFENQSSNREMFVRGIAERKQGLEQYFWTDNTVRRLMSALTHEPECCCLTTPTLAHAWHMIGRDESLLDIDTRFQYLPKYQYFDIQATHYPHLDQSYQILIFDPPFFYLSMETMFRAVSYIVKNNYKTKIMIGFLKREEATLMRYFGVFGIRPTNFVLEYSTVKPNKWKNYCLYSNVDLPGIKRIHEKK